MQKERLTDTGFMRYEGLLWWAGHVSLPHPLPCFVTVMCARCSLPTSALKHICNSGRKLSKSLQPNWFLRPNTLYVFLELYPHPQRAHTSHDFLSCRSISVQVDLVAFTHEDAETFRNNYWFNHIVFHSHVSLHCFFHSFIVVYFLTSSTCLDVHGFTSCTCTPCAMMLSDYSFQMLLEIMILQIIVFSVSIICKL